MRALRDKFAAWGASIVSARAAVKLTKPGSRNLVHETWFTKPGSGNVVRVASVLEQVEGGDGAPPPGRELPAPGGGKDAVSNVETEGHVGRFGLGEGEVALSGREGRQDRQSCCDAY